MCVVSLCVCCLCVCVYECASIKYALFFLRSKLNLRREKKSVASWKNFFGLFCSVVSIANCFLTRCGYWPHAEPTAFSSGPGAGQGDALSKYLPYSARKNNFTTCLFFINLSSWSWTYFDVMIPRNVWHILHVCCWANKQSVCVYYISYLLWFSFSCDDAGRQQERGYPMSQFVRSLSTHPLSYEARELACHFADAYARRLLGEPLICTTGRPILVGTASAF